MLVTMLHFCPTCGNMLLIEAIQKRDSEWKPKSKSKKKKKKKKKNDNNNSNNFCKKNSSKGNSEEETIMIQSRHQNDNCNNNNSEIMNVVDIDAISNYNENNTISSEDEEDDDDENDSDLEMAIIESDIAAASADIYGGNVRANMNKDSDDDYEDSSIHTTQMRFYCRSCPYIHQIQTELNDDDNNDDSFNSNLDFGNSATNAPSAANGNHTPNNTTSHTDLIISSSDSWSNVSKLSGFGIHCSQCGSDEAYYKQVQTRSSDEPMTVFYRCTKCGHQWRD